MRIALMEREQGIASDYATPTPMLTKVNPERGLAGEVAITVFFTFWCAGFFGGFAFWWIFVAAAALYWTSRCLREVFWNRLKEPVISLSSIALQPGQDVLLECELRAKDTASIHSVVAAFQSVETYGEDSHTESYEEWTVPFQQASISATPTAVQQQLQAPIPKARRWSGSSLNWHLTLRVEVQDGMTVTRRYPIRVSGS
ncbi:MAG: hypothetical protein HW403_1306 [Dehalococcoidia bacterium]|nr:hypothetical protein [Dehalococcoidia bacterium]